MTATVGSKQNKYTTNKSQIARSDWVKKDSYNLTGRKQSLVQMFCLDCRTDEIVGAVTLANISTSTVL